MDRVYVARVLSDFQTDDAMLDGRNTDAVLFLRCKV